MSEPNNTLLCDFYELTMANGYFELGKGDEIAYFDVFFRQVPDGGGFAIAAGLEQVIHYIKNLRFTEDDIAYLRSKNMFSEGFLDYLRTFRFTGDIYAVPEGTPIFPGEPILTVRAPSMEAQFVETADRHQGKPRLPCGTGTPGRRIRIEKGTGSRRRDSRRPRGIHRRMRCHRLHHFRP